MSDLTLGDLIDDLLNDPDSNNRVEAARVIENHAATLNAEEKTSAIDALNHALRDPDPMVIMAAMHALSAFPKEVPSEEADHHHHDEIVEASVCAVCGKPEALVDPTHCEIDGCPYRK